MKQIIWINGAYGIGKSSVATELHEMLKDSFTYDPENAGNFIRENLTDALWKDDFQDYPMWRKINVEMIKYLFENHFGAVIVPMTVINMNSYNEIIVELQNNDISVKHFIFLADKRTIYNRLIERGEEVDSWCVEQIDRCIYALTHEIDGIRINTVKKTSLKLPER